VPGRRVGQVDGSWASDVVRGEGIGRPSEAAAHTLKGGLGATIAPIDQAASRAGLRRVARFDYQEGEPRNLDLVGHQRRPGKNRLPVLVTPRSSSNCHPVANARPIFQGHAATSLLSFRYQPFGRDMVDISCPPRVISTTFVAKPVGRFRAGVLQPSMKRGPSAGKEH
jgi:hypothetical protein